MLHINVQGALWILYTSREVIMEKTFPSLQRGVHGCSVRTNTALCSSLAFPHSVCLPRFFLLILKAPRTSEQVDTAK